MGSTDPMLGIANLNKFTFVLMLDKMWVGYAGAVFSPIIGARNEVVITPVVPVRVPVILTLLTMSNCAFPGLCVLSTSV